VIAKIFALLAILIVAGLALGGEKPDRAFANEIRAKGK